MVSLCHYAPSLFAQNSPAPRFVNYSAADGLPSNTVYAITQDADGVLWVGTRNGLASFDGVRFRSWKEYGRVNALAVDTGNRLWVGMAEGIAVVKEMPDQVGHDGAVGHGTVSAGSDRQSFGGPVRAMYADAEGYVWATVGDTLLLKLSYRDGIREEATPKPAESSMPSKTIPPSCIPSRTVNRFPWADFPLPIRGS